MAEGDASFTIRVDGAGKTGGGGGVEKVATEIGNRIGAVAGGIMKLVDLVLDVVMDWGPVVAFIKILKAITMLLLYPLVPILKPALQLLAKTLPFLQVGMQLIAQMVEYFVSGKALAGLIDFFGKIFKGFGEIGAFILDWLWNGLKGIWEGLKSIGSWIFENIIKPGFNALLSVGIWIWDNIIKPSFEFLLGVGEWIWTEILKPAFDWFMGIGLMIWNTILKPGWEWFLNIGDKIWEVIKTGWEWFLGIGDKIWDNFFKPAINGLIRMINNAFKTFGLGTRIDYLNDFVISDGKVYKTNPKDTIVGTKNGMPGGNTTININNPTVRSDRDINELVRQISMELQKNMRGRVSYT